MEENNWLVEQEKRKITEDHNTNKRCKAADVLKENIPEDGIRQLVKKYEKREDLEPCDCVLMKNQPSVIVTPDKYKLNSQEKKPRPPNLSGLEQKTVDKTKSSSGKGKKEPMYDRFGREICPCCKTINRTSNFMPIYAPQYSFLEEPLNLSQTPNRRYPIDLSQPGCSGINNFQIPIDTSKIKLELVDPVISSTIVKSEPAVKDFSAFVDFLNMEALNHQHNQRAIEDTRSNKQSKVSFRLCKQIDIFAGDIAVQVDENEPTPIPNMESDNMINNLSDDFNDFTRLMRPRTAIEPETIDLTSYTPELPRTIDAAQEIIEVPDEIPINNRLKPGVIEYINLDDSDDEVTTTVTTVTTVMIHDSVISVNDSIYEETTPVKKEKSKKRNSTEEASAETSKAPAEASRAPAAKVPTRTNFDCPVCLESLKHKPIVSTICGHIFCAPCSKSVIRRTKTCPNCRKSITSKSIHPIYLNFD